MEELRKDLMRKNVENERVGFQIVNSMSDADLVLRIIRRVYRKGIALKSSNFNPEVWIHSGAEKLLTKDLRIPWSKLDRNKEELFKVLLKFRKFRQFKALTSDFASSFPLLSWGKKTWRPSKTLFNVCFGGIQQLRGPNFTKCYPILTLHPPQMDKNGHFTYYLKPFIM